jgi:hypothetical protein
MLKGVAVITKAAVVIDLHKIKAVVTQRPERSVQTVSPL